MIRHNLQNWQHEHTFGQDRKRSGEQKTLVVITITATMMVVEIITGMISGSMALLADGLHMASHATALAINAFAYVYARRHAGHPRFSFGTGKVNALGGFTGSILLGIFSLVMALESFQRIFSPVEIAFNQALLVAVLGLFVNGISMVILKEEDPDHAHDHAHHHSHNHHHDHNLKSAYLHVLADALTSVLAIFALLSAKYFGFMWMDPVMGILGAFLVARWSLGLLRSTSAILLDFQGPAELQKKIKEKIEQDGDSQVADLHLWTVGPNVYSAIISIVTHHAVNPLDYKKRILAEVKLDHITVEVQQCDETGCVLQKE